MNPEKAREYMERTLARMREAGTTPGPSDHWLHLARRGLRIVGLATVANVGEQLVVRLETDENAWQARLDADGAPTLPTPADRGVTAGHTCPDGFPLFPSLQLVRNQLELASLPPVALEAVQQLQRTMHLISSRADNVAEVQTHLDILRITLLRKGINARRAALLRQFCAEDPARCWDRLEAALREEASGSPAGRRAPVR